MSNRYPGGKPVDFAVARFRFTLRARDTLCLPLYKGSALRGAFGHAFRRLACARKPTDACAACALATVCAYSLVFAPAPPPGADRLRKYTAIPRPFVFDPPSGDVGLYQPGESLSFGLALIGKAIDFLPYFVLSWMEAGEAGLGRGRGRYQLASVQALHPLRGEAAELLEDGRITPRPDLGMKTADFQAAAEGLPERDPSVRFLTMTRLKTEGHLQDRPEFHILTRNLLRRISALSFFYHGQELAVDFRGLIALAQDVRLGRSDVTWREWERFSQRQEARMALGGIVGQADYHGDVRPFRWLLAVGQQVNVGKNATFGLGKFVVVPRRP